MGAVGWVLNLYDLEDIHIWSSLITLCNSPLVICIAIHAGAQPLYHIGSFQ